MSVLYVRPFLPILLCSTLFETVFFYFWPVWHLINHCYSLQPLLCKHNRKANGCKVFACGPCGPEQWFEKYGYSKSECKRIDSQCYTQIDTAGYVKKIFQVKNVKFFFIWHWLTHGSFLSSLGKIHIVVKEQSSFLL